VVDHVVALEGIATLLVELTRKGSLVLMPELNPPKPTATFSFVTCPHCHGSLQETSAGDASEFGCHVGHRFSLRSLYAEQADQVEFAMWAAIRALEESGAVAARLAERAGGDMRGRFLDKQRTMALHASTLRAMVLDGSQSTRRDIANLP
jgi:hypothetical protein